MMNDFAEKKDVSTSIDSEMAIIDALINKSQADEVYIEINESLYDTDFTYQVTKNAFNLIKEIISEGSTADPSLIITLANKRHAKGVDLKFLKSLAHKQYDIGLVKSHISVLQDCSTNRRLISVSKEIHALSEQNLTIDEKVGKALQLSENIEGISSQIQEASAVEMLRELGEYMDWQLNSDSELTGITTGFTDLDQETGGFNKGDLVILAARPAMGKTALALNLVSTTAKTGGSALIYSMEMPKIQNIQRIISSESGVDYSKIKNTKLIDVHNGDWTKVNMAFAQIKDWRFGCYDEPGLNINQLISHSRSYKRRHGLDLIVIDYLQLMSGSKPGENRVNEISEISRELKKLARSLDVPIIALSQLNRSLEQRSDKRPMMSDLRESGSIEQDADMILFIYRDEVYNPDSEHKGVAEIIIGKQRSGPTGTVRLNCDLSRMSFKDFNQSDADLGNTFYGKGVRIGSSNAYNDDEPGFY
ncbi:MAG: replicative DNA helicase [Methyloprofundus sp.]|nr:replicative DNA helicase [Methyloprofundus sp.]